MRRIGPFFLLAILFAGLFGCSEKSASVVQTGLNLKFANCLTCGVYLWIDGEYITTCSTDHPNFVELSPGSHSLFARGNIVVADSSYCWSRNFSVSDGQVTEVTLDCRGARCQ